MPGPDLLAALLTRIDGRPFADLAPVPGTVWAAPGGALCPIATGAALCDLGVPKGLPVLKQVLCPLLLAPFVAGDTPVTLRWAGVALCVSGTATTLAGDPRGIVAKGPLDVTMQRETPVGAPVEPAIGRTVGPDTAATLARFAERTFAPATEASRAAGAGGAEGD